MNFSVRYIWLPVAACLVLAVAAVPFGTVGSQDLTAPFDIASAFVASGYMGDGEVPGAVRVHNVHQQGPDGADILCVKISYQPGRKRWAGVYWQSPADNWGDKPGRRINRASKITFWAMGQKGGEIVEFKAGGIDTAGKQFRDSFAMSLGTVPLTTKWKKFEIPLRGKKLSSVLGAFAWVATADDNPSGLTFYLYSIRYE